MFTFGLSGMFLNALQSTHQRVKPVFSPAADCPSRPNCQTGLMEPASGSGSVGLLDCLFIISENKIEVYLVSEPFHK